MFEATLHNTFYAHFNLLNKESAVKSTLKKSAVSSLNN